MTQEDKKAFDVNDYFKDQDSALDEVASKGPTQRRVASGWTQGKLISLKLNNGDWGPSLAVKFQLFKEVGNAGSIEPSSVVEFVNLPFKPADYDTKSAEDQAKIDQKNGINFDRLKSLAAALGTDGPAKPETKGNGKSAAENNAAWTAWKKDVIKSFLSQIDTLAGALFYVGIKNPTDKVTGKYLVRKNGNAVVNYSFFANPPDRLGDSLTPETFWMTND